MRRRRIQPPESELRIGDKKEKEEIEVVQKLNTHQQLC